MARVIHRSNGELYSGPYHKLLREVIGSNDADSEVLALVPVAANTGHWKNHVFGRATGVCFLYDQRLQFLVDGRDEGKGAPMSCAVIYGGKSYDRFHNIFIRYGAVIDLCPLYESRSENIIGSLSRFFFRNLEMLPADYSVNGGVTFFASDLTRPSRRSIPHGRSSPASTISWKEKVFPTFTKSSAACEFQKRVCQ